MNTPKNLLSMQLGVINQGESKKASSFVGQGFSDAIPVTHDSSELVNQSFQSTMIQ